MAVRVGRRQFIFKVGGFAVSIIGAAKPARAEPAMPVVAVVNGGSADTSARLVAAFREGLGENGYVDNHNVAVEYHWLEGQNDRLPPLMADLVRRGVAVIATPTFTAAALAAKAATATIPIIFAVSEDPVRLGLAASFARPGGNAAGINIMNQEVTAKRLRLLYDLVPKAVRIAVLVNPANPSVAESMIRDVRQAAPIIGLQIQTINATSIGDIDGDFAAFGGERPDALFVAPDSFFTSRRNQFAALTAGNRMPSSYAVRELVEAGGLMSYGSDLADAFRQVGDYTSRILKGAKPADLPIVQSTKFEFVLNLSTAKALGIEVPSAVLSIADDVIQ